MLKKSVVIKAPAFKPNVNFKINNKTLIFFTLFICGIIMGVHISEAGSAEWHAFFTSLINDVLFPETGSSLLIVFIRIFLPFFSLLLICFVTGLSGMGTPFVALVPLLTGCFFGIEITQFYINFGMSGIGGWALIYLPSYATATATVIKCCCHCVDISGEIFIFLVTGKGEGKPIFKEYILRYVIYIVPVLLGSLITTLFYRMFGDLFSFV